METNNKDCDIRKILLEFMAFVSQTPFEELAFYTNEEFVDKYLKQLKTKQNDNTTN